MKKIIHSALFFIGLFLFTLVFAHKGHHKKDSVVQTAPVTQTADAVIYHEENYG